MDILPLGEEIVDDVQLIPQTASEQFADPFVPPIIVKNAENLEVEHIKPREHVQNRMDAPVPRYMTNPFAKVIKVAEVGQIVPHEYVQTRTVPMPPDVQIVDEPSASGHGGRHQEVAQSAPQKREKQRKKKPSEFSGERADADPEFRGFVELASRRLTACVTPSSFPGLVDGSYRERERERERETCFTPQHFPFFLLFGMVYRIRCGRSAQCAPMGGA